MNPKKYTKVQYLCVLGVLVAVELAMKLLGLDNVQLTPFLKTSFLSVPVALGAMLLGPMAGAIMGGVFGAFSLIDAIRGTSLMTAAFFSISPFHTVVLCLGTRILMGVATGWIFRLVHKADRTHVVSYYVGGLAAPLLNTVFFMGYIVLAFYSSEFIQSKVAQLGATGPLSLIVLMVGLQGTLEWAVGLLVGGSVTKGVAYALKMDRRVREDKKV